MNVKPSQFVDMNIVIYAYDIHAGAKHSVARALMNDLWRSQTGCLSIQVLQEFYVNITQKIATPVDIATATQIIRDLSDWTVHTPIPEDVVNAIRVQQRYQLSFWDALVVWSAARLGCAVLWSEDLNPGQTYEGVQVQNPFTVNNEL
jgi:predicted nucleic acid-binding protein